LRRISRASLIFLRVIHVPLVIFSSYFLIAALTFFAISDQPFFWWIWQKKKFDVSLPFSAPY
jgi:hypothetical protein